MKKISTKVLIPVVLLAVIAVISAVTGLKNANELHTSSKEISDTTVNLSLIHIYNVYRAESGGKTV